MILQYSEIQGCQKRKIQKHKKLDPEYYRDPYVELGLLRLVMKNAHSQKTARTSAENGKKEERGFGDAPLIPAGLFLVESHRHKARQIDDRQIHGDIGQNYHILFELSGFLHLHRADFA